MDNPCYLCERRRVGCHGVCEDYAAFREKCEAIREEQRREYEAANDVYAVKREAIRRSDKAKARKRAMRPRNGR